MEARPCTLKTQGGFWWSGKFRVRFFQSPTFPDDRHRNFDEVQSEGRGSTCRSPFSSAAKGSASSSEVKSKEKKKYGVYEKSENGVRKSVLDLVCDGLPYVISASAWPA